MVHQRAESPVFMKADDYVEATLGAQHPKTVLTSNPVDLRRMDVGAGLN